MKSSRWQQRFENFEKAFLLLQEALQLDVHQLSNLEKEGIIQRFEYTFELAWKTLNDYLKYSGINIEQTTPRAIIKAAFAANIISDGQIWINMLEEMDSIKFSYEKSILNKAMTLIFHDYANAIQTFFLFLKPQSKEFSAA